MDPHVGYFCSLLVVPAVELNIGVFFWRDDHTRVPTRKLVIYQKTFVR